VVGGSCEHGNEPGQVSVNELTEISRSHSSEYED
jgi:hypothetical protein